MWGSASSNLVFFISSGPAKGQYLFVLTKTIIYFNLCFVFYFLPHNNKGSARRTPLRVPADWTTIPK